MESIYLLYRWASSNREAILMHVHSFRYFGIEVIFQFHTFSFSCFYVLLISISSYPLEIIDEIKTISIKRPPRFIKSGKSIHMREYKFYWNNLTVREYQKLCIKEGI